MTAQEEPLASQAATNRHLYRHRGLDGAMRLVTDDGDVLKAEIGTLLFQVVTGRQVPVFLASSFAFITPIILAKGQIPLERIFLIAPKLTAAGAFPYAHP